MEMSNKEFGKHLEKRTKVFALRIIKLSLRLPDNIEFRVIKNQIVKSGTSIGANYREANKPRSRADFKSRISICQSEANETIYWLELIIELRPEITKIASDILDEASQLLAIFTSIIIKLKN